ncbi:MAG: hypothetical protein WDA59_07925 [Methanofastidiosum sp.]|jgi:hypothetical protein
MEYILGSFEYSNRIKIWWKRQGNIHTVSKHEQLDYEELCFEHTEPEVYTTTDPVDAREKFFGLIQAFVS